MTGRVRILLVAVLAAAALGTAQQAAAEGITFTCTPGPCGVWKATDVTLRWSVDFGIPHTTSGCEISTTLTAEGRHTRTCTVTAGGGGPPIASSTASILIDKSAPVAAGVTPTPGPNARGWHTAPVTFTVTGADVAAAPETSGLAACDRIVYAGPDTPTAVVRGTCRDGAGNVSAPIAHPFAYDATGPALATASATPGDRMVTLRWKGAEGPIVITRRSGVSGEPGKVVFAGRRQRFVDQRVTNGTVYEYRITTSDDAGNATTRTLRAVPARRILSPALRSRMLPPVQLRWSEIRNADYYNVQVFRGRTKLLSAWPKAATLRLPARWSYLGRGVRLDSGTYRVFVWPGFGARARERYGRIVGTTTFVVP